MHISTDLQRFYNKKGRLQNRDTQSLIHFGLGDFTRWWCSQPTFNFDSGVVWKDGNRKREPETGTKNSKKSDVELLSEFPVFF
jgi:hypothetical protein